MSQFDGEIRINTKIETKDASSQMIRLQNMMAQTANKIDRIKEKMESIGSSVKTDEFKEIEAQINRDTAALNKLEERMTRFIETGGNTDTSAFRNMQYDAAQLENSIAYAKGEMKTLLDEGKAFKSIKTSEEYKKLSEELYKAEGKMKELVTKQKELKKGTESTTKSMKKGNSILQTLGSRLKGILLSLFVFNWISKAWNGMISAVTEGIKEYAKYSSEFNESMSQMETSTNALKSAIIPTAATILNAMVPSIVTLCDWLTSAINAMNMFIAILQGKDSFSKAVKVQKDYAKSLDGTAKSAKNANKALASFHELNNLSESSGNASGNQDYNWQETQISSIMDELKKNEVWKQFEEEANKHIDWMSIYNNADELKGKFIEIFNNPDLNNARKELKESIIGLLTHSGAAVAATEWNLIAGAMEGLNDALTPEVREFLTKKFTESVKNYKEGADYLSEFADSVAEISESMNSGGFSRLIEAFSKISLVLSAKWIDDFSGFTKDIIGIWTSPVSQNTYEWKDMFESLFDVMADLFEPLNWLSDWFINNDPDYENSGIHAFLLYWTSQNSRDVADMLKKTTQALKAFHQTFQTTSQSGSYLHAVLSGLFAAIDSFHGTNMLEGFERITATFKDFKNIWKTGWEELKRNPKFALDFTRDYMKAVVNSMISNFENGINSFINGINKIVGSVNAVTKATGSKVVLNKIDTVSLPRLANGGITTGSTIAQIGEAGKEAVLPLENNTGWMDKLAEKLSRKTNVVFEVQGDEEGIFKITQRQAEEYFETTGNLPYPV